MTNPTSQYSSIPFDVFAPEQWDYSLPHSDDDLQWAGVVRNYLSLTPLERFRYHRASHVLSADVRVAETDPVNPLTSLLTSPSNIARVLAVSNGRQTQQERTISALRCGAFCDAPLWLQGSVVEDYDDWDGGAVGEEETPLESASRRTAGLVYLVDEEAVEGHVVKLLWLDVHGRCVWRTRARPEGLMGLAGAFKGGYSLAEAVESHGLFGNLGE